MNTADQQVAIQKENLSFGEALEALKQGQKVSRSGWNGKGMFIYMVNGSEVSPSDLRNEAGKHLTDLLTNAGFEKVKICSHIDMKAADDSIVIGWLASQTDMQANDWGIIE